MYSRYKILNKKTWENPYTDLKLCSFVMKSSQLSLKFMACHAYFI